MTFCWSTSSSNNRGAVKLANQSALFCAKSRPKISHLGRHYNCSLCTSDGPKQERMSRSRKHFCVHLIDAFALCLLTCSTSGQMITKRVYGALNKSSELAFVCERRAFSQGCRGCRRKMCCFLSHSLCGLKLNFHAFWCIRDRERDARRRVAFEEHFH